MKKEQITTLKKFVEIVTRQDVNCFMVNSSWDARTAVPDSIKILKDFLKDFEPETFKLEEPEVVPKRIVRIVRKIKKK